MSKDAFYVKQPNEAVFLFGFMSKAAGCMSKEAGFIKHSDEALFLFGCMSKNACFVKQKKWINFAY
jgi:hypothetical protein